MASISSRRRPTRLRLRTAVAAFLMAALAVGLAAPTVQGQGLERIRSYDVQVDIQPNGDLEVTERIGYDFGAAQRHGIFRDIPVRFHYDDAHDRIYPIEVLSVQGSPGTPAQYELEPSGPILRIRIGDPDRTITGAHQYTISYRVQGALNGFPGHDELYWNLIGADWAVAIERATGQITAPRLDAFALCFAGPVGSNTPCDRTEVVDGVATFEHALLPPFHAFTAVVSLPKGTVQDPQPILEERWNLFRAFSVNRITVPLALVVFSLVTGWFGILVWRVGRDRRAVGAPVDVAFADDALAEQRVPLLEPGVFTVEYQPPDELRPGQVGTLVDEEANVLDVTATIVDLAVRGYLRIEEVERGGLFRRADWRLTRLKDGEGLLGYERILLDGLFADAVVVGAGEPVEQAAPTIRVSELKDKFMRRLAAVRDALYTDAVGRGWFPDRPDRVRNRWISKGFMLFLAGAAITAALAWRTHLALVSVPIALAGLALMPAAARMPRRTPKGTGLVRRVRGFRRYIETAEADQARFAEQENLFYQYLPYAIVFGLTEKWARAFEGLAARPPDWYAGTRPFSIHAFSDSVQGFTVSSAGTLASTPSSSGSSGFGGGGGSGGGGGGGGGGSW